VDSLKVLDPKWPIREADIGQRRAITDLRKKLTANCSDWIANAKSYKPWLRRRACGCLTNKWNSRADL